MPVESLGALYTDLQRLVSIASGVDQGRVILADQGRPPPEPQGDLYATYNPIPVRAVGQPRTSLALVDPVQDYNESLLGTDWQDFEATTITQLDLILSCNFLNEGARDAAWKMHNANFRYPVADQLWSMQVGWRGASEVRRLTDIYQAGLQPRYQVDVNLYVETQITDEILRAAGFSLNVEDEDGNEVISLTSNTT